MKRLMHDILELPQRSEKPRKKGLTIVVDRAWFGATSQRTAGYKDYIDWVKSTSPCLWVEEVIVQKNIKKYRDIGIDIQMGGVCYEIAVLEGKQKEYMERSKALGINVIEVENHAGAFSLKEMTSEVKKLKKEGFKVVGEVGAKWAGYDETRPRRDAIYVDKVVKNMSALLEAGVDYVYWEGMVVRALIGNNRENHAGQEQLFEVVKNIGQDNIVFEMWTARGNPNPPLWAWLVQHFGPDVNLGNISLDNVSQLETIRRGCYYDPGHPFVRWLSKGKPTANWWEMESTDYKVDLS